MQDNTATRGRSRTLDTPTVSPCTNYSASPPARSQSPPVKPSDKNLGMDRPIARRDFLQGAALGAGGMLLGGLAPELVAAAAELADQDQRGYYPPTRLGMRGSHVGSFEAAHA